jgi:multidrug efflux pump subunit AcrA (membrane-fusion protein)
VTKVLTVVDGRVVEKRIRLGQRAGEIVEVLEGIAPGEAVIAEPGGLTSGQAVTVES